MNHEQAVIIQRCIDSFKNELDYRNKYEEEEGSYPKDKHGKERYGLSSRNLVNLIHSYRIGFNHLTPEFLDLWKAAEEGEISGIKKALAALNQKAAQIIYLEVGMLVEKDDELKIIEFLQLNPVPTNVQPRS